MQIDVIEGYDALAGMAAAWNAVYEADPEAHFYLSWTWIAKFLQIQRGQFLTLAARPDEGSDPVAFLPIGFGTTPLEKGGFITEVYMASAGAADFTGLICRPEFDDTAIPAFARAIAEMRWARFHVEDVLMSDRRFDLFYSRFPKNAFKGEKADRINAADGVDIALAPRVELPDSWDAYLAQKLSANTRQKVRRFLGKIENDASYSITHATGETVERDLKILTDLWARQWRPRQRQRTDFMAKFFARMLRHCFENEALLLPILWLGEKPVAAHAVLVDRKLRSYLFFIGGRDDAHKGPPAGFVLHADTIRHAIGQGMASYDLLQGNETYKYSFGAEDRSLRNVTMNRTKVSSLVQCLDRRCLPHALEIAVGQHKAGHLNEAERGYRQILGVDPRFAPAVQGYGRLLSQRGNRAAAEKLIKAYQAGTR